MVSAMPMARSPIATTSPMITIRTRPESQAEPLTEQRRAALVDPNGVKQPASGRGGDQRHHPAGKQQQDRAHYCRHFDAQRTSQGGEEFRFFDDVSSR